MQRIFTWYKFTCESKTAWNIIKTNLQCTYLPEGCIDCINFSHGISEVNIEQRKNNEKLSTDQGRKYSLKSILLQLLQMESCFSC